MKKNIFILSIMVMIVSVFTGCSSFKSKKISNSEDIAAIMENVAAHFPNDNLLHIDITADDHLSDKLGMIQVFYYDNNKVYLQTYIADLSNWGDPSKSPFHGIKNDAEKPNRLKKASDFNFDNVQELVNKAIAFIEENTDEFEGFKLYSIEQGSKSNGEMETEFVLNATKKGEGTTREGRNIVTTYYEFEFVANEQGEVIYQE